MILLGIGIGTVIDTGNVVDLANLDLVDFDILSPDGGSRLQPRPRTRLENLTPNPTSQTRLDKKYFFKNSFFDFIFQIFGG